MATSSNALKLELVTPAFSEARPFVPMDRKKELWPEIVKKCITSLCRHYNSEDAGDLTGILAVIFLQQWKEDKGLGGAIAFIKHVFPEAERKFLNDGGGRRKAIIEVAECKYCGRPLKRINAGGYECETARCTMFGVGISAALLRSRPRTESFDEIHAATDGENKFTGLAKDIARRTNVCPDETRLTYRGIEMDERLVNIFNHPLTTAQDKAIALDYLTGDFSYVDLGKEYGKDEKAIRMQFKDMNARGKSATKFSTVNS